MYIDPNTGGVLFQVLAGIFVALSGIVLVFSRQIRTWFARLRRRGTQADEEENQK
jgi:uncharacterized iron-regulated membrane protein